MVLGLELHVFALFAGSVLLVLGFLLFTYRTVTATKETVEYFDSCSDEEVCPLVLGCTIGHCHPHVTTRSEVACCQPPVA
jgi:hypothetical protein